jgi:hypothetical protein
MGQGGHALHFTLNQTTLEFCLLTLLLYVERLPDIRS